MDNLHYEKCADGTDKCIEDEIPFEVPEGWAWCRLSSITEAIGDGDHQPPPQAPTGIPFLVISNVSNGELSFENTRYVPKSYYDALPDTRKPRRGDLLFTVTGSYGIPVPVITDESFCFQRHIAIIRPCYITSNYLAVILSTAYIKAICDDKATGTAQKTVGLGTLRDLLIPIAPYEEQDRICSMAEKAIEHVEEIEKGKDDLQQLIEKLKTRILDLAIRGQLVRQNPDDEPASVLLDRIHTEKEELIKQSKIKRDKRESIIFRGDDNSYYERVGQDVVDITEELPFSIPDSWCWARISSVFEINPRNKLNDELEVSFIPMPLIEDGFSGRHTSEIKKWSAVKTGFTHFSEGDIGIAKITPCFENRKSTVFCNLVNGFGAGTTELHVLRSYGNMILSEYALAFVKTQAFIDNGKQEFTGAVGQQRVGKDYISETLFPVPPYQEQVRIVEAIRRAFSTISTIEAAIS